MNKKFPEQASAPLAPKDKKFNGWDDTPSYRRNIFQKVASQTHGIVTPGNVTTVAANALAMTGIVEAARGNYAEGAALFAAGRSGDWLDGMIARASKTQSWIGEGLDVMGDKVQVFLGLGVLSVYGSYPLEASVPKLASQAAIVGVSAYATKQGANLHPGLSGKIGLGATGVSMVGFEAANALSEYPALAESTTVASYALTAVSIAASAKAAWDYWQEGRNAAAGQPQIIEQ